MLPKPNRLNKEKKFKRVFQKGKGFRRSFLFSKVYDREDEKPSKFGFVVPIKVSKKAVVRNKTKRRMREIVRSKLEKVKDGKDVVIVAQSGIESQTFHQMKQNLLRLLEEAGIT